MFRNTVFVFTSLLLSFVAQLGWAEPTVEEIKRQAELAYAKIDKLSISCMVVLNEVLDVTNEDGTTSMTWDGTLGLGSCEFRFDRATKQLAIGSEGVPGLLIADKKLWILAWSTEGEKPFYLEIENHRSIGLQEIDEAMQALATDCPWACQARSQCLSMVLPFLNGGMDRLFSKTAKILHPNGSLDDGILLMGHPDSKFMVAEPPKLDPEKFPVCIQTIDGSSRWNYAFRRDTGLLSGAIGFVDRAKYDRTVGKLSVILKPILDFGNGDETSGEFKELPFELPPDATILKPAELKEAYSRLRMKTDVQVYVDSKSAIEKHLEEATRTKLELNIKLSTRQPCTDEDVEDLKHTRHELARSQAEIQRHTFLLQQVTKIIAERKNVHRQQ